MPEARFAVAWLDRHRVEAVAASRDAIIGIGHALAEVDSLVARLRDPVRAARLGATPPRGILFHGQPGTGKTLLARYLAASLGNEVPLFEVASDELSADRLRGMLRHLARTYPRSVVFVDEADSWAISRDDSESHSPETRLLLTAALSALDGLVPSDGPVVVVATNREPWALDPALVRPGRLGIHVEFALPAEAERAAVLALYLSERPTEGWIDLARAARLTPGESPAALRAFVEDAAAIALAADRDAIHESDLVEAIRRSGRVRPDRIEDDARRWRTAVHEAGHVAVAWVLRRGSWISSVSLRHDGGRTVLGSEDLLIEERPDDEVRDAVVTAFGGMAAERCVLDEPTSLGTTDVAEATRLVVNRLQSGFDSKTPPLWLEYLGRNAPENVKNLFGGRATVMLAEAKWAAEEIVEANVEPITAFARRLHAAHELAGPDLQEAITAAGFVTPPHNAPDSEATSGTVQRAALRERAREGRER